MDEWVLKNYSNASKHDKVSDMAGTAGTAGMVGMACTAGMAGTNGQCLIQGVGYLSGDDHKAVSTEFSTLS